MDVEKVRPTPDCPNCHVGNTWGKHMLTHEYDHPEANAFCKNCRCEFYAPPKWWTDDDYKDKLEVFR